MIRPVSFNSNPTAIQQKASAQLEQNTFNQALEKAQQAQDDQKLKAACQDLESIFLYQVLSIMRSTIPPNALLGRSQAEDIFQGMLDQEFAKSASKTGSIGLADLLYHQLKTTLAQENTAEETAGSTPVDAIATDD